MNKTCILGEEKMRIWAGRMGKNDHRNIGMNIHQDALWGQINKKTAPCDQGAEGKYLIVLDEIYFLGSAKPLLIA